MKLDRNIPGNGGRGKYALILLRKIRDHQTLTVSAGDIAEAIATLDEAGVIDWGQQGTESEFFVMKLKDENVQDGLQGYAIAAEEHGDLEWSNEVFELAKRAGPDNPWRKRPD